MSIFNKTRIKAIEIFQDSFDYLQKTYDQAVEVFTPASPFGQILTVLANISELIFFYIESVATELNIHQARNIESIYGLSRLTGHDPIRGISARGMLGIRLNNNADFEIEGPYVRINNGTRLQIDENGLPYFLKMDSDFITLEKGSREFINVELVQGEIETQRFTGTGNILQSYNVTTGDATDQFNVTVTVNGVKYKNVESLYDMNYNEKCVLIKTGINGGLNIFFGNNQFGYVPELGAIIQIEYIKTRGSIGNLDGKTLNFKFIDEGETRNGESIDLNEIIAINIVRQPNFGSDSEDPDFTRLIAPYSSKSFVLANPTNYVYYLKKYDFFSFVDAYNTKDDQFIDDDNIIYLFLIPNIAKKITSDFDYFTIPENEFYLSEDEKNQVYEILDSSGRQFMSSEVRIVNPIIKKYSLNIALRYFENFDKNAIRIEIRNQLNNYFLNINRRDRIPRSDLIAMIENIDGIDSVNVFFVSEENETAIRNGFYEMPVYGNDPVNNKKVLIENKRILLQPGEDPNLGLDEFGDVNIDKNELALIRGGWLNRTGNLIEELPTKGKASSLNILFKEEIPYNLYTATQQENYNKLKRNRSTSLSTQPDNTIGRSTRFGKNS